MSGEPRERQSHDERDARAMRFEITGTEGEFGRDVVRVYESPSEDAAREQAARDGIAVTGVDLLLDMPGFAAAPPPQNLPPVEPPPPTTHGPSHAAVSAADAHFEPLDAATRAALVARPPVAAPPAVAAAANVPAGFVVSALTPADADDGHGRLQAAATAAFWFACAAYVVGGLGVAVGAIAGVVALSQQAVPSAATARLVAIAGLAIGGPALFAAVVSHAVSGASLALREITLRRRRKRDY